MFTEQKNCLGTSKLLAQFLPCLLCHLQIDTIVGQVAMFYSSLQVAISQSRYSNLNLKPKQVQCSEAIYSGRDVVAISPTGYGNFSSSTFTPLREVEQSMTCTFLVISSSCYCCFTLERPYLGSNKKEQRRKFQGDVLECENEKQFP